MSDVAWIEIVISLFFLGFLTPLLASFALKIDRKEATRLSLIFALFAGAVVTAWAGWSLAQDKPQAFHLLTTQSMVAGLPELAMTVYIDRLAAFFMLLIGGLSLGVTIFSFEYLKDKDDQVQVAAVYNLFVLFGLLFVVADHLFFAILFLECTTLTFAFLVLHKHRPPQKGKQQPAVQVYLIANHIGGVFVAAALLILAFSYPQASFDLETFRTEPAAQGVREIVFLLAFVGFGIKAGIVPFHIWVAIAHPYSPTNTHAMSLGIMIKIAIYGMLRVFFQFLKPASWWWGLLVLLIAALTSVVSVGNAIRGRTLKESLADHSVENIGIILAAVGLALICVAPPLSNDPLLKGVAALALVAGLYHLLNHTVFKGLLYLCTGAIDYLTGGVVELEKLGGLIHRFKWTSAAFLVGSVAIAGFPPFNGFVSEWLTLHALFSCLTPLAGTPQGLPLVLGILLSILLLVAAFASTALAFVKIAGETLLGAPRDESVLKKERTHEPLKMRGVMLVLAILCLALGVFPSLIIPLLGTVTSDLGLSTTSIIKLSLAEGITIQGSADTLYTSYLHPEFLLVLTLVLALALSLGRRVAEKIKVWTCGRSYDPHSMQYTGSALTSLTRGILPQLLRRPAPGSLREQNCQDSETQAHTEDRAPLNWMHDISPALESPLQASREMSPGRVTVDHFRQAYNGLINLIELISRVISGLVQNGDLRSYLLYIFGIFVVVLVVLAGGGM